MRRRIVRDHQRVFVLFMLKEVEQTVLLHQTRHEIEIRLPILHAIVPRLKGALQLQLIIGEPQILKNLPNDVRDGLLLKDSTVRCPRQEPKPGHHGRAVVGKPAVASRLAEAADHPVEVAFLVRAERDAQRDPLADDVLELDVGILGEQIEVEIRETRDAFLP